ncbi:carbohydrate ABC transporter permease [Paenibacillus sp.]|uniref:carbohydrate ABC transporter permease n=1 Tax=Paenibacillus sp. TaxID=58172 RepID=UPI002D653787|nr:carbohydrate ABC transporter permease [Paenibacillus sp.]HZG55042.1 carbohydrate ABC transporter permease [Paenibacillus sp.]
MTARLFRPVQWLKYAFLWLGVLSILFPPYVVFLNAFKGQQEFAQSHVFDWPRSFLNFENFEYVLSAGNMLQAFGNTGYIMALSLAANLLIGTMAAYVLGRFEFRLKKYVMAIYIAIAFIPTITTQVAIFTVIKSLGLFNTIYAPVVLYIGTDIMQLYVYLQFIRTIPYELDEAAMVEGASLFRIYRSIVLPLLMPAVTTMMIIKSINIYNDMYIPYLYMPAQELGVVSTTLMRFVAGRTTEWQYISASILIIMLPLIALFLFAQKYVFAGIVTGAVK